MCSADSTPSREDSFRFGRRASPHWRGQEWRREHSRSGDAVSLIDGLESPQGLQLLLSDRNANRSSPLLSGQRSLGFEVLHQVGNGQHHVKRIGPAGQHVGQQTPIGSHVLITLSRPFGSGVANHQVRSEKVPLLLGEVGVPIAATKPILEIWQLAHELEGSPPQWSITGFELMSGELGGLLVAGIVPSRPFLPGASGGTGGLLLELQQR